MECNCKIVINNKASRALIFLLASAGFFSVNAVAQSKVNERAQFVVKPQNIPQREKNSSSGSINPYSPITNKAVNSGVLPSYMLPDKLAVPERDPNYKSFSGKRSKDAQTKDELKDRMLEIDYYSKGMDGYYKKSIDMGYVGEGWTETKELREAVGRVRGEISRNIGGVQSSDPEFIKNMRKSSSSVVRVLGGILDVVNTATKGNRFLPDSPGYRGSNPIVPTVATPGRYKYIEKWD